MKDKPYQPKGGLCVICNSVDMDCSNFEFDKMPIIKELDDCYIVKCKFFGTYYKKEGLR